MAKTYLLNLQERKIFTKKSNLEVETLNVGRAPSRRSFEKYLATLSGTRYKRFELIYEEMTERHKIDVTERRRDLAYRMRKIKMEKHALPNIAVEVVEANINNNDDMLVTYRIWARYDPSKTWAESIRLTVQYTTARGKKIKRVGMTREQLNSLENIENLQILKVEFTNIEKIVQITKRETSKQFIKINVADKSYLFDTHNGDIFYAYNTISTEQITTDGETFVNGDFKIPTMTKLDGGRDRFISGRVVFEIINVTTTDNVERELHYANREIRCISTSKPFINMGFQDGIIIAIDQKIQIDNACGYNSILNRIAQINDSSWIKELKFEDLFRVVHDREYQVGDNTGLIFEDFDKLGKYLNMNIYIVDAYKPHGLLYKYMVESKSHKIKGIYMLSSGNHLMLCDNANLLKHKGQEINENEVEIENEDEVEEAQASTASTQAWRRLNHKLDLESFGIISDICDIERILLNDKIVGDTIRLFTNVDLEVLLTQCILKHKFSPMISVKDGHLNNIVLILNERRVIIRYLDRDNITQNTIRSDDLTNIKEYLKLQVQYETAFMNSDTMSTFDLSRGGLIDDKNLFVNFLPRPPVFEIGTSGIERAERAEEIDMNKAYRYYNRKICELGIGVYNEFDSKMIQRFKIEDEIEDTSFYFVVRGNRKMNKLLLFFVCENGDLSNLMLLGVSVKELLDNEIIDRTHIVACLRPHKIITSCAGRLREAEEAIDRAYKDGKITKEQWKAIPNIAVGRSGMHIQKSNDATLFLRVEDAERFKKNNSKNDENLETAYIWDENKNLYFPIVRSKEKKDYMNGFNPIYCGILGMARVGMILKCKELVDKGCEIRYIKTDCIGYVSEKEIEIADINDGIGSWKRVDGGGSPPMVKPRPDLIVNHSIPIYEKNELTLLYKGRSGDYPIDRSKILLPFEVTKGDPNVDVFESMTHCVEGIKYSANSRCKSLRITSILAGGGKSTLSRKIANSLFKADEIVYLYPTRKLLEANKRDDNSQSTTYASFFRMRIRNEGDDVIAKRKVDISKMRCLVCDEIEFCEMKIKHKLKEFMEEHDNVVAIGNGDSGQLPPIENLNNITDYDRYNESVMGLIFDYEIVLEGSYRATQDEERLERIRGGSKESVIAMFKTINEGEIKITDRVITALRYTSQRINRMLNNQEGIVRLKKNKMGTIKIDNFGFVWKGQELRCTKYFLSKINKEEKRFYTSSTYTAEKVGAEKIIIDDGVEMDGKRLKKHFTFAYANTCHSWQGSTIDNREGNRVIICDWNHRIADKRWLYTAITRATNLDNVFLISSDNNNEKNIPSTSRCEHCGIVLHDENRVKQKDRINNNISHSEKDDKYNTVESCTHCNTSIAFLGKMKNHYDE